MKTILIERNGTKHEVDIERPLNTEVVIRQDTRVSYYPRVFVFRQRGVLVPEFEEVEYTYIDGRYGI